MTETELNAELKKGHLSGIYIFHGEEDYLKNYRASEIKKIAVGDNLDFASFNTASIVFGEGELDTAAINDAVMSAPFMSDMRAVTVTLTSFENLDKGTRRSKKDGNSASSDDDIGGKRSGELISLLKDYASGSMPEDTVLVIIIAAEGGDTWNKRSKASSFVTACSKFCNCVEFPFQSDSMLAKWIIRHVGANGAQISPELAKELIKICGSSMYSLIGETEKVSSYVLANGRNTVTSADITEVVSGSDSVGEYAFTDALTAGDFSRALSILRIEMEKRKDPLLIMGSISSAFRNLAIASAFIEDGRSRDDFTEVMSKELRMNPYVAQKCYNQAGRCSTEYFRKMLGKCVDADREMKTGASGYSPIERLIGT